MKEWLQIPSLRGAWSKVHVCMGWGRGTEQSPFMAVDAMLIALEVDILFLNFRASGLQGCVLAADSLAKAHTTGKW